MPYWNTSTTTYRLGIFVNRSEMSTCLCEMLQQQHYSDCLWNNLVYNSSVTLFIQWYIMFTSSLNQSNKTKTRDRNIFEIILNVISFIGSKTCKFNNLFICLFFIYVRFCLIWANLTCQREGSRYRDTWAMLYSFLNEPSGSFTYSKQLVEIHGFHVTSFDQSDS